MSFDRVASFYDTLAGLVFGSKWTKIQLAPAEGLNKYSQILIVGGGTGLILPHLKESLEVTYLDMSGKMIQQAKERERLADVTFVQADFLKWETTSRYDAIYMPFFLDCFDEETLEYVIRKTMNLLKPEGELNVVDFQRAGFLKNLLVAVMYWFFRVFSGLKGGRLLDINGALIRSEFFIHKKTPYLGSWVFYGTYCFK